MKKLKKLLSIVLAVAMVLSLVVVTSADESKYTITINDSTSGYTYAAYQIFAGDLSGSDGDYTLSNITWGTGIDSTNTTLQNELQEKYGSTDAATIAELIKTDSDAEAFAKIVGDYLVGEKGIGSIYESNEYTIEVDNAGYYLVKNTAVPTDTDGSETVAYTSYILKVVGPTTVEPKRDLPNVDKDLDKTDAGIGETITYYLTASLPSNLEDYDTYLLKFTDTLGSGLTYVGVSAVYVYTNEESAKNKTEDDRTLVWANNYDVDTTDIVTDGGGSFTVTLNDVLSLTADDNDSEGSEIPVDENSLIQVVFTAELNKNAVIGNDGNPNDVDLEYSNNPNGSETGKTEKDTVITWTYELDVNKTDKTDSTKTLTAEFVLYKLDDNRDLVYLVVGTDGETVTDWTSDKANASTLTSTNGNFKIKGLDEGVTYYLEETKAPEGYNLPDDPFELVISATHSTTLDNGTWLTDDVDGLEKLVLKLDGEEVNNSGDISTAEVTATIENAKGSSLPSTGGIGTTIFYVVGGVLVLGAVVLLITKRRMGKDEK